MLTLTDLPDRLRSKVDTNGPIRRGAAVMQVGEPSYYDPFGCFDCSGCGEEHVLFPGRVWVHEL